MGRCDKLYAQARNEPGSLRFDEACRLAECFGFEKRKGGGSHIAIYKYPRFKDLLNFQPDKNGKAKPYQVRQLLDAIEELGLELQEGE